MTFQCTVRRLDVMNEYCSKEINANLVLDIIAQAVELSSMNQEPIVVTVSHQNAHILLVIMLYLVKENTVRVVTSVTVNHLFVIIRQSVQLLFVVIVAPLEKVHE